MSDEQEQGAAPEDENATAEAPEAPEAAEATEAPQDSEQPAAEPTPEAAPAAEQPESEAKPEPEPPAAERQETAKKPQGKGGSEKEAVPGANLEPIAITDERELSTEEQARAEAEAEERASREAAQVAEEEEEPSRATVAVPSDAAIQATGKRKSSIARVVLRAGEGSIEVNGRPLDQYFPRSYHQSLARQPLLTAGYESSVKVKIRVHGGGISGQAGAVRHGIARALCDLDPELRGDLKRRGMLTRDAREKERRKAGLKKARKRPQFSKR
jgi:small subunit ribosomal protein S9